VSINASSTYIHICKCIVQHNKYPAVFFSKTNSLACFPSKFFIYFVTKHKPVCTYIATLASNKVIVGWILCNTVSKNNDSNRILGTMILKRTAQTLVQRFENITETTYIRTGFFSTVKLCYSGTLTTVANDD
jgi:hypothetical protein